MWRFMEGVQNPNKKIKVDVDKHQRDSEYDRSIVTLIVTVCVFVRHLFTWYPFYFDFHSARIIFDVSSGFYLWNINKTTA